MKKVIIWIFMYCIVSTLLSYTHAKNREDLFERLKSTQK